MKEVCAVPSFTKMAIKAAFLKLLDERPLNQITVKDIVEVCGINRNSFYYHFQDIPALIEEIVTEEADRIIAEYPTIDSIEICLTAALDFARKNRRAILHIYNSVNRALYEQYLWKVCEYAVRTYGETVFAEKPIKESDKNLILRFYECECFGMVIAWMKDGMQEELQDDIHRLCTLRKGMLEEMVERSIHNK